MKVKEQKKRIISSFIIFLMILVTILMPVKAKSGDFVNDILLMEDTTITEYESSNIQPLSLKYSDISGKEFFIKNMYTGQYLDVSGGIAENGRNVQQYKLNGTDSQRWYLRNNGDGTFCIYTRLGNNGAYRYALEVNNGSGENYANIQIREINGSDAQKFKIGLSVYSTFILYTKASNFSKVVVLNGPTCNQGQNVDQYTFQAHANEYWILEPVSKNPILGVEYAKQNYNQYVMCYPNLNPLGDCANFASQCMLAGGMHYQNDWKIYRKNNNYPQPANREQLDNSWELCPPKTSPWTSAREFGTYWKDVGYYYAVQGKYAYEHPQEVMNLNIKEGDVMQQAQNILGVMGNSTHTMYITGYTTYEAKSSYVVTGHSREEPGKPFLQICKENPNDYFILFQMTL